MNILKLIVTFISFFTVIYCANLNNIIDGDGYTKNNKKPPSFLLERPIACIDTETKEKFIFAIKTAAEDYLKLTALFHCPRSLTRISELTDVDVRIQNNEMPETLRAELQKILEQLQYGTLQTDNDLSFIRCIDHIKTLLLDPAICADKSVCLAVDLDNFFTNTQRGEACTRDFMKDKINRMVNVVKANKGLMSPTDYIARSELINDLQAILDAAPYKETSELAHKHSKKEQIKISARTKLEELLGLTKNITLPVHQETNNMPLNPVLAGVNPVNAIPSVGVINPNVVMANNPAAVS